MDMSEVAKFDVAVGKIKLSEAMRIGARLRPQGTRFLFSRGKSCALGAALEGAVPGAYTDGEVKTNLMSVFPALDRDFRLYDQIAERNDNGQSRESIADWLESQGL